MVYFLERIARHLFNQNSDTGLLVFPSRRAGLYFLKYYSLQSDKPVWAPEIMTINEFFRSLTDLRIAESETLLFELYKINRKLNSKAESFDEFYFWGGMLINDFEDIDKYMADVPELFRNIKDLKNIDEQFADIDDEKAEIIRRFWKNFEPEKPTAEKEGFISVWSVLNDLYSGFRSHLRARRIAYEGMIFRDVAEKFIAEGCFGVKWKTIHFIGFNALNSCEATVMKALKKEGIARFYWDFDNSYISGGKLNSAGFFLKRNLITLGNDMPGDWSYDTLLSSDGLNVKTRVIETTSDVAQVKLIHQLLAGLPGIAPENAHHTAVILGDENLLVPILTSLPDELYDVNITMGYPLKMTGVYTLVRSMLNLQRNTRELKGAIFFRGLDVIEILEHQLIKNLMSDDEKKLSESLRLSGPAMISATYFGSTQNLKPVFSVCVSASGISDQIREILAMVSNIHGGNPDTGKELLNEQKMRDEFIYRVVLSLNRLDPIVKSPEVSVNKETFIRILDGILRSQSVPFTGEPLSGIQIMGILETRALDFTNLVILSVNEGVLPVVSSGSSFVPLSIREAFGLPTINHQESVFAYHFYRLLHRAENVTFIYNSDSGGLRTGEISRFLVQMKYEQILKPEVLNLGFVIKAPPAIAPVLERIPLHSQRLGKYYPDDGTAASVSPTAINTWLGCRMRFYYRYVSGLKEPEVAPADFNFMKFGKVLHQVMHNIYAPYTGRELTAGILDPLIKEEGFILDMIDSAAAAESSPDLANPSTGNDIIIRDVLLVYVLRVLCADRSVAPFRIIGLEMPVSFEQNVEIAGKPHRLRIGGNIDRIDLNSGVIRIVDYKTGTAASEIESIAGLFDDDREKDTDCWLQTLLYCEAYLASDPHASVRPSVYKVKELSGKSLADKLILKPDRNCGSPVEDYR
ncbi:MAG: PD-(D/E)XK nuclease family protein, partial [Bacteroidales bacterium]